MLAIPSKITLDILIAGVNFFDYYREGNGVFYDETNEPF